MGGKLGADGRQESAERAHPSGTVWPTGHPPSLRPHFRDSFSVPVPIHAPRRMIQLELGGQRWPLAAGETIIGSAPAAAVRLEAPGVLPSHAVLRVVPDGHAAIRLASPEALRAGQRRPARLTRSRCSTVTRSRSAARNSSRWRSASPAGPRWWTQRLGGRHRGRAPCWGGVARADAGRPAGESHRRPRVSGG
jgi:hypothetical protein